MGGASKLQQLNIQQVLAVACRCMPNPKLGWFTGSTLKAPAIFNSKRGTASFATNFLKSTLRYVNEV